MLSVEGRAEAAYRRIEVTDDFPAGAPPTTTANREGQSSVAEEGVGIRVPVVG